MQFKVITIHEIGGRAGQEDSFAMRVDKGVFAIADGMGGHPRGDKASRAAASTFVEKLNRSGRGYMTAWSAARAAVSEVGHDLHQSSRFGLKWPGTTLTAVHFLPPHAPSDTRWARVMHVGDSACFLLSHGVVSALTEAHGIGCVLHRAILCDPHNPAEEPDVKLVQVRRGDRIVLCTDGVTNAMGARTFPADPHGRVSLEQVEDAIRAWLPDATDNFTALLIEVDF